MAAKHALLLLVQVAALIVAALLTDAARVINNAIADTLPAATAEKAPTCLVFGSVCTKDKDCCSDSCLLFLCALPYEKKENLMTPMDTKQIAISSEKSPTCLAFGSVCTKDKDCCSDNCLLFLCALPYEKKENLMTPMDTKQITISSEKSPTCLAFGNVCTKDKDCCSDSCLLFLCALPYEKKENLMSPMDTKQIAISSEKAPTCLAFGSVCTNDKDCCSDSCLLFLCALPYEKKENLMTPVDTKQIAISLEKAPTCLAFGTVCTKDKDCCSDSCLLFLCALPYEKEENLMTPMGTKQIAMSSGKAPTCLSFGSVCSNDKDCCSDSCLLFLCALPYEQNKKLEEADGKIGAKQDEDKKAKLSLT